MHPEFLKRRLPVNHIPNTRQLHTLHLPSTPIRWRRAVDVESDALCGLSGCLKCSTSEAGNMSSSPITGQLDFIQLLLEKKTTIGDTVMGYTRISRHGFMTNRLCF